MIVTSRSSLSMMVYYFDNEERDVTITKVYPKVLLKELYVKRQSGKTLVEDLDHIWVKVGERFKKIDPRIGDVISFNAYVEVIDLDYNTEIYLKNLSDIKISAGSNGQKFKDFWQG